MKHLFLFIALAISLVFHCQAQESKRIDSLVNRLAQEEVDTSKVMLHSFIAFELLYSKPDSAYSILKNTLIQAQQLGYKKGIAHCYNNIGNYYRVTGKPNDALDYYLRSLDVNTEIDNPKRILVNLFNIGSTYQILLEHEKALDYTLKAMRLAEKLNDQKHLIRTKLSLGLLYYNTRDFPQALIYFEEIEKSTSGKGSSEEIVALQNIGKTYYSLREFDKAKVYFRRAIALLKDKNNLRYEATLLANMAEVYTAEGQFAEAEKYIDKSVSLRRELNDLRGVTNSLIVKANILRLKGEHEQAISVLNECIELSKKTGLTVTLKDSYEELEFVYQQIGDYKNAYNYLDTLSNLKDSIYNNDQLKKLNAIQAKYEKEKSLRQIQEKELQVLQLEKNNARNKLILSGSLSLVSILFVLFLFYTRKRKQAYDKELTNLRELRDKAEEEKRKVVESPPPTMVEEKKPEKAEQTLESITIAIGDKIIVKKLSEIVYFNAEEKYVFLHDKKGKKYIVDYTLQTLWEMLPSNFMRIHRSFIINKDSIGEIRKGFKAKYVFVMNDVPQSKLVSSRGQFQEIRNQLNIK